MLDNESRETEENSDKRVEEEGHMTAEAPGPLYQEVYK
jgi:hypothetical protein